MMGEMKCEMPHTYREWHVFNFGSKSRNPLVFVDLNAFGLALAN